MELGPFVYFIRVIPAVLLLWLVGVVIRAPLQERANRLFALFLLVLAVGFLLEFFWATLRSSVGSSGFIGWLTALSEGGREIQGVLGVVDPPLLLAATLAYLNKDRLLRAWWMWAGYALVGGSLWWGTSSFVTGAGDLVNILHIVYVNGTYLVSFLFLVHGYLNDSRHFIVREFYFLAVAVGFAAFSRTGAFFLWGAPEAWRVHSAWTPWVVLLAAGLLLVVVWLLVRWSQSKASRSVEGVFIVMGLLLIGFSVLWWFSWHLGHWMGARGILFDGYYSMRWIVVAGIMGYGSMRYQLFDFDLRVRQAVSLGVATLVAVGAGMVVAAAVLVTEDGFGLAEARVVGIVVMSVVIWPAWAWSSAMVRWFWPASDSVVRWKKRRLEIYEATLEHALGKRRWGSAERRFVETLRDVFEVSPEEHKAVVARLENRAGGPGASGGSRAQPVDDSGPGGSPSDQ